LRLVWPVVVFASLIVLTATPAAARDRPSGAAAGCKVGPAKDVSEIEARVAACTVTIDTAKSPAALALALSFRAQGLLDLRQCDAAIDDLTRAKDISPNRKSGEFNNIFIWTAYYWQYCKGDFDRAIEVLDEAVRIFPKDPAAYNERSQVYEEKHDWDHALGDINRAIALANNDPYRASSYNGRAVIWKNMGVYDKAVADFGVAIGLNPKAPKYLVNRGEAWRLMGNLERALADQNRALEIYAGGQGSALGLMQRGETLRYLGQYDQALADYDGAVRADPEFAPAYTGRGLTYERTGDVERAKADFHHGAQG
jgi:tetratricopeptide (TPR) repeat protein